MPKKSSSVFVGLDIGTGSVKALAVDAQGNSVASASRPLTLSTPKPGWAEQDPAAWWAASLGALKAVTAALKKTGHTVEAIGLSGQMHSSVFLDKSSKVIRPALLWCDGRTTEQCKALTAKVGENQLRDWVSNPALEGFTLPKVLWLRDREPKAFAKLAKVLLPKDYIRFLLTGSMATEPSDASGTLMMNVREGHWSAELMKAAGLSLDLLPEIGGSTSVLGRVTAAVAKATGLAEGTPVVGGGADNACGAVGVGAVAPGATVASWGTSGTVLCPTASPKVDPKLRAHTFCHAVPNTWYVMGVMLAAGGAFAWYERELAPELRKKKDATQLLSQEAEKIPAGAEGLTFLPYLQGERTPHRDADARGAFVGLSLAHTRAHLTRAVLEGICFGLRDSLEIIQGLGLDVREVLVTGGGAKSAFVRQLQADIYGKPVVPVAQAEGPAFGAALLGAVGVGAFKDVAAATAKTLDRGKSQAPKAKAHASYDAAYATYGRLYGALRSVRDAAAK